MSKRKSTFYPLRLSGDPHAPLVRTPAMTAVDRMFLDRAERALADAGCSALAFLAANPDVSVLEVAKQLNRGASAHGLIMAIYREAAEKGVVRETAKDLLLREIRKEFPVGWTSSSDVGPVARLVTWICDLKRNDSKSIVGAYGEKIIRHLAVDHPPPEGWKPEPRRDPLLDELFDRYWPVATTPS